MMPKFMSAGWLGGPRGPEKRHDEINSTLNIQQKYTEKKTSREQKHIPTLGILGKSSTQKGDDFDGIS